MGVKTSQACQYCSEPYQDFIHLFLNCPEVTSLRDVVAAKWPRTVTRQEWALGTDNNDEEEKAMSFVLLEFIFYVQRANWAGEKLSLSSFKGAVRAIEVVESRIAIKNSRIERHRTKWEEILKLHGIREKHYQSYYKALKNIDEPSIQTMRENMYA